MPRTPSLAIIQQLVLTFHFAARIVNAWSNTSTGVGDYIVQGLGVGASDNASTTKTTITCPTYKEPSWSPNAPAYTPSPDSFTNNKNVVWSSTAANVASDEYISAQQCWTSLGSWRQDYADWYNSCVATRAWPVPSMPTTSWYLSSYNTTIYPSSVSTYTLCDHSPRADIRPTTTAATSSSLLSYTLTSIHTPAYPVPVPCKPDPVMCRLWFYNSNIPDIEDDWLEGNCGEPAHEDQTNQTCLIGGGPVELVYWPVTTTGGDLCARNGTTLSQAPNATAQTAVTTLGHTFTTGSVHLSFHTLYAYYDGWGVAGQIGPTFSDYIVPLASSDVSTQCGGWASANGPGTQLDYADLNYPVPASAYACQDRCTSWMTAAHSSIPTECNTIWSDFNPILAVPTGIRDLVPAWSTCKFWDEFMPNFLFDPPRALQQQPSVAGPSAPTVPTDTIKTTTIPAAPASTPNDNAPASTSMPSSVDTTQAPTDHTPEETAATAATEAAATEAAATAKVTLDPVQTTREAHQPSADGSVAQPAVIEPSLSDQTSMDSATPDVVPGDLVTSIPAMTASTGIAVGASVVLTTASHMLTNIQEESDSQVLGSSTSSDRSSFDPSECSASDCVIHGTVLLISAPYLTAPSSFVPSVPATTAIREPSLSLDAPAAAQTSASMIYTTVIPSAPALSGVIASVIAVYKTSETTLLPVSSEDPDSATKSTGYHSRSHEDIPLTSSGSTSRATRSDISTASTRSPAPVESIFDDALSEMQSADPSDPVLLLAIAAGQSAVESAASVFSATSAHFTGSATQTTSSTHTVQTLYATDSVGVADTASMRASDPTSRRATASPSQSPNAVVTQTGSDVTPAAESTASMTSAASTSLDERAARILTIFMLMLLLLLGTIL